jgi:hypothetical protein
MAMEWPADRTELQKSLRGQRNVRCLRVVIFEKLSLRCFGDRDLNGNVVPVAWDNSSFDHAVPSAAKQSG